MWEWGKVTERKEDGTPLLSASRLMCPDRLYMYHSCDDSSSH